MQERHRQSGAKPPLLLLLALALLLLLAPFQPPRAAAEDETGGLYGTQGQSLFAHDRRGQWQAVSTSTILTRCIALFCIPFSRSSRE